MANLRSGGPSFLLPAWSQVKNGPQPSSVFSSCVRTVSRKDVFEPPTSTGSMVVFLSLCLYLNKFVLLSVLTHKEKICLRIREKPLRENGKSLLPIDVRRLRQRRFWATHVNRKWGLLPFYMPGHYQICIAEFLFSYKDDLPKGFNQTTAQCCKKSTSGWLPSLKNAVA